MSDPRPNELAGQVQPNTLTTQAGRASATPPVSGPPRWTSPSASPSPGALVRTTTARTRPSSAPAVPSATTSISRPAARRPFSAWALIVAVIIGINIVRSFGSSGGFGGFGADATTEPVSPPVAAQATGNVGSGGKTIAAVDVPSGTVVFGTSLNESCDVSGAATRFSAGTPVWWYAHLNLMQAATATVVTVLKVDGVQLDRGTGPDSATRAWDGLCAGSSFRYYGSGTYRFEVWDDAEKLLLASGEYEIGGGS